MRERLARAGFSPDRPLTKETWSAIPILSRDEVREHARQLTIDKVPKGHGTAYQIRTSGSTGMPLTVTGTGLVQLFWDVLTLREATWHGRDPTAAFHAIRRTNKAATLPDGACYRGWGRAFDALGKTGPVYALDIESDIDGQLDWLRRHPPKYLLTYPTNLAALVRRARERDIVFPSLEQVVTVSETVTSDVRHEVRDPWSVPIMDLYSAQEVGYIALQAPGGDHYLVPEEVIHVEILDEQDQPVSPGEVGRVVVTHLHNYAMPLIRYDIGDYAELGGPSPCGRTLMVLNRILGRSRGMLSFPDGSRHWPHLPYEHFESAAGVIQYQIIQHELERLEFRCTVKNPMTGAQKSALTKILQDGLGYPFAIEISEVDSISRSASGKFEDFISRV
jgi:phenylacetate-CoA ligase